MKNKNGSHLSLDRDLYIEYVCGLLSNQIKCQDSFEVLILTADSKNPDQNAQMC